MSAPLVLSLFPGIGLLDMAFEDEGFCIVRGPDRLWGGDIKRFHPPPECFDGVIGGPPCQAFSTLVALNRAQGRAPAEDLIPEYLRVVGEARPAWWVMENVVTAPIPAIDGYIVDPSVLDNRWLGGVQSRRHRFSFGTRDGRCLTYETVALENSEYAPRLLAGRGGHHPRFAPNDRRPRYAGGEIRARPKLPEALRLQGLPEDFFERSPFTAEGKAAMLGNGVPLPMGRALAKAVRKALERDAISEAAE